MDWSRLPRPSLVVPWNVETMDRRLDFIALGDPVLDIWLSSEELPRWDDKHLGRSARLISGGTEANAVCAAARQGVRCALLGHAGAGVAAELHKAELNRHGVSLEFLIDDEPAEGAIAVVYVSAAGERAVTYVPARRQPDRTVLQRRLAQAAADARLLYLLPYDAQWLREIGDVAARHETLLAVDVERATMEATGMRQALCEVPDVLCFNAAGFRAFTGQDLIDEAAVWRVIGSVRARVVVVTLGPAGSIGSERDGPVVRCAAAPARRVDTTGAGDTFNGTWVAAWLQGCALDEAMAQAAVAAARCIEAVGPRGQWDDGPRATHPAALPIGSST